MPPGWVPYDDYAPCSGLYIPTDATQLPPPISWQTCEPAAGISSCRRVALDWSPQPTATGELGSECDAAIDASGHAVASTVRVFGNAQGYTDHALGIVADVDGPVYNAILATLPNRYGPYVYLPPEYTPPRWLFQVLENNALLSGGYIAGTIGNLKPQAHGRVIGTAPSYFVSDIGVLQVGPAVDVLDFSTGNKLYSIQGSLPMSFEWMFHNYIFWQGNSGRVNDVGRWDPDGGAIDFINYGFDPNHAAGSLGTDGKDMVWIEGHGNPSDAGFWTTCDFWTSPYVTDPSQLQPRRLRSAPCVLGVDRVPVGCGFAAAWSPTGEWILRLSDGWGWFLPNTTGWTWQSALAVSCTEVFVGVYISGPITTMARIPIASLGPGLAPD